MHLQVYYVLSIFYGPWWESLLEISGAGHPHLRQRFVIQSSVKACEKSQRVMKKTPIPDTPLT